MAWCGLVAFSDARQSPSVDVLDPNDAFEGLTSRQQLFVTHSFSGLNDAEAYRRSGDCSNMTDASIGTRAHEMARLPKVQAKLRQMREKREAQTMLAPLLTRDFILQRLMRLSDHADKDSVKVTALVALGKTVGIDLFRETTRVERVERSVEDVERELKARLKDLQVTIEGEAKQVNMLPSKPADRRRKPRDGQA